MFSATRFEFRVPFSFAIKLPVQLMDCGAAMISDLDQVPNPCPSKVGAMLDVATVTFEFRIKTKLV